MTIEHSYDVVIKTPVEQKKEIKNNFTATVKLSKKDINSLKKFK